MPRGWCIGDIKPANLWLDRDTGRVKILDFGLARPMAEDAHLTQSGYVLGTPSHMAPEQARGETVDERCDLFSLGVVLYRLCTGQMPFRGETTMAVLTALAMDLPRPASECNSSVPPELSALIDRLLAKQPEKRLGSARAVVEAIQAIEQRPAVPEALPVATLVEDPTMAAATVEQQDVVAPREPAPAGQTRPIVNVSVLPDRRRSKRKPMLVGLAASLLAGALLSGIIIIIRNKDGTEARITVPDDAEVEVLKEGKPGCQGRAHQQGARQRGQAAGQPPGYEVRTRSQGGVPDGRGRRQAGSAARPDTLRLLPGKVRGHSGAVAKGHG